jgi:hypothetical protein
MVTILADIPWLGDHDAVAQHGIGGDVFEQRRMGIVIGRARQHRRQIEAEAIDPGLLDEMAQAGQGQRAHGWAKSSVLPQPVTFTNWPSASWA